ncbi:hypothetical protein [Burkholderia cenocepacia]|uniref:hypothetical protein n=1 Tax=Burkholderia cenocepacia TaxID=95486 RepID=UPI00406C862E
MLTAPFPAFGLVQLRRKFRPRSHQEAFASLLLNVRNVSGDTREQKQGTTGMRRQAERQLRGDECYRQTWPHPPAPLAFNDEFDEYQGFRRCVRQLHYGFNEEARADRRGDTADR